MTSKNVHPKFVQELMGHASVAITLDTYSHMLPGMDGLAADALATVPGSAPEGAPRGARDELGEGVPIGSAGGAALNDRRRLEAADTTDALAEALGQRGPRSALASARRPPSPELSRK